MKKKFDRLARQSYRKVHSYAGFLCFNDSDAEDLTQEALFRAFRQFDCWREESAFSTWVMTIIKRLYCDLRRRRARGILIVPLTHCEIDEEYEAYLADPGPTPEEVIIQSSFDPEVVAAMRLLPTKHRNLLWQFAVGEMSYQEASMQFNIPLGTVKSRLFRATRRARQALEGSRFAPARSVAQV